MHTLYKCFNDYPSTCGYILCTITGSTAFAVLQPILFQKTLNVFYLLSGSGYYCLVYIHITCLELQFYLLASGASPPSHVNGPILYIYVMGDACTYRNIICASNFACALSHSPTMLCIQLVYIHVRITCFYHRLQWRW